MREAAEGRTPADLPESDTLRAAMRGVLLAPEDEGYALARTVHNGMVDKRPAVIARCSGVADVMRALDFGVRHAVPISIRSGGHGLPGFAVCDGGVMIDLSGMSAVSVDPARRVARVQGGATWGGFDHETQAFGLATTGGVVGTTGVAGLTLGGGHGFLMRRFGLACDNLLAAEVLTADGRLVRADTAEHPDLFWALRGGGGNFGVVTSFEFRLHEVGPVLGGLMIWPFDQADRLLRAYEEFASEAPDEQGLLAVLATLPDGTKAFVNLLCHSAPGRAAEGALQRLRSLGSPMADQVQVMPYTAVQSIVENFNPRGMRNYWKTVYVKHLTQDAIEILTALYSRVPAPLSHVVVYTLGGAVTRVAADDTAVSYRDAGHVVIAIGMWADPAQDAVNVAWVREVAEALQPFAYGGFYPNYEESAGADRLRSAFGQAKFARLAAVKHQYDPGNVFRLNQNIQPASV